MKRLSLLVLPMIGLSAVMPAHAEEVDPLVAEARAQTKAFAQDLKSTLMKGMKQDGPIEAIHICNTEAPEIAAVHSKGESEASGWEIGRTSDKLRNPENAPDVWEAEVLASFADRAAAGEDLQTMEATTREAGTFRYMKAIPVGGPCVVCHGKNLAEPVATKLSELYPNDQARGYSPGELRGAFTLTYTFSKQ